MGMDQVFVTNTNEDVHEDRYDGEAFVFPPGERVLVPVEAAIHMLGFNLVDKTDTLVRLGWATIYDPKTKNWAENPQGAQRLGRFVFDKAVMVSESSLARALEKPVAA